MQKLHVTYSGCKASEGQKSIYSFFKSVTKENIKNSNEEWDSDIYDNIDKDDFLQVDEESDKENDNKDTDTFTLVILIILTLLIFLK
ncbi:8896_t:CDS:2 [Funneliformis mosseae]|uniref:8896_t:CDS:1 n=1 Tax=Funneliformis mosseae TaxID=27381 RepID=A0A9N8WNT2_FUNMO|nr:8896_t:CDS:2 [Funneliformis mosseae]